ncbi:hypothetical protein [Aureibacillus halotolerans]|uniref:Sporulation lipoprotein YhcN/YlaJ n=1 Tax=Aureibacillus halotolerans TaxID=1508390 RepID=A0A4R6UCI7_9BACI|nr:hypothetical protein [Aureibacillus halotolerans]TDQ42739.1 hypothetical protein EV213_101168 [Aureibacillus halotolerans]
METKKWLMTLSAATLIAVAGCSGGGSDDTNTDNGEDTSQTDTGTEESSTDESGGEDSAATTPAEDGDATSEAPADGETAPAEGTDEETPAEGEDAAATDDGAATTAEEDLTAQLKEEAGVADGKIYQSNGSVIAAITLENTATAEQGQQIADKYKTLLQEKYPDMQVNVQAVLNGENVANSASE